MTELLSVAIGGTVAGTLLLAAHLAGWNKWHPVICYIAGTGCLLVGYVTALAVLSMWLAAAIVASITGIGGATIAVCWLWRITTAEHKQQNEAAERLLDMTAMRVRQRNEDH